jgi:tetratricopeptide (TPR) repeat protein
LGDAAGAVEAADRALALNPRHAKAWVNRANGLMHAGRFGDVMESAQRAIEIDPQLAGAYLAMAAALGAMGRGDEARACLSRGLKALPGHALLQKALQRM